MKKVALILYFFKMARICGVNSFVGPSSKVNATVPLGGILLTGSAAKAIDVRKHKITLKISLSSIMEKSFSVNVWSRRDWFYCTSHYIYYCRLCASGNY